MNELLTNIGLLLKQHEENIQTINQALTAMAKELQEIKVMKTANPRPTGGGPLSTLQTIIDTIFEGMKNPLVQNAMKPPTMDDKILQEFQEEYKQTFLQGLKDQRTMSSLAVQKAQKELEMLGRRSGWEQVQGY